MFTNFLCMLTMSVAWSSSGMFNVDDRPHRLSAGRGDGSAQRERSVICDCLVLSVVREYENCVATTRVQRFTAIQKRCHHSHSHAATESTYRCFLLA